MQNLRGLRLFYLCFLIYLELGTWFLGSFIKQQTEISKCKPVLAR